MREVSVMGERIEGSHCDDIETVMSALDDAVHWLAENDRRLSVILTAIAAVHRLESHLDASAGIALAEADEQDRLRARVAELEAECDATEQARQDLAERVDFFTEAASELMEWLAIDRWPDGVTDPSDAGARQDALDDLHAAWAGECERHEWVERRATTAELEVERLRARVAELSAAEGMVDRIGESVVTPLRARVAELEAVIAAIDPGGRQRVEVYHRLLREPRDSVDADKLRALLRDSYVKGHLQAATALERHGDEGVGHG